MYKYFKDSEFKKCVPACSIAQMNPLFLSLLDEVREVAGIPLVINSAYRSISYEWSKGRSGSSSHCKGIAVDIRCNSSINRAKIIDAIFQVIDKPRIGVSSTFIHLDIDSEKNPAFWLY